jgi:hypothetical protein
MWHITFMPSPACSQANRAFERFEPVLGNDVVRHACLRAEHNVGILGDGFRRGIGLREIDIIELCDWKARQPNIGNVHEGVEARARLGHDVTAEAGKVVGACVACRYARCRALLRHHLVRRNAEGRAVWINMAVQVDEARRHQFAIGIEHTQCASRRNVGVDSLDLPETDADIAFAAQRLARVEYVTAFDNEIELIVRPHGAARRRGGCERESTR